MTAQPTLEPMDRPPPGDVDEQALRAFTSRVAEAVRTVEAEAILAGVDLAEITVDIDPAPGQGNLLRVTATGHPRTGA